jgi:hypothetical protein
MSHQRLIVAVCAVVMLAGGCDQAQRDRRDYVDAIEQAEAAGVSAYWLGEEFEQGALDFDRIEADFPEGIVGIMVDGLMLNYLGVEGRGDEPNDVDSTVRVQSFSHADWDAVAEKVRYPVGGAEVTWESIVVAGWRAELGSIVLDGHHNGWNLVVPTDDGVVLVGTFSRITEGGGEANALMDPEQFLEVAKRLRRYPE